MIVGYARTSTLEQQAGLEAQQRDLAATGCTKIFQEQVSSLAKRAELISAIEFVRDGDTLCVVRLDRLARSTSDLLSIVKTLETKGVGLRILDFGGQAIDTLSPSGKMVITMMGAIAEFEVALMKSRQREGIAKAKADGRYRGRAPTARRKTKDVIAAKAEGLGASAIAARCGISRASVYRVLATGATS